MIGIAEAVEITEGKPQMKNLIAIVAAIPLLVPAHLSAGDCRHFFVQRQVVHRPVRRVQVVQQVVQQHHVVPAYELQYLVGQQVRIQALITQAVNQNKDYAEFQQFQKWKQSQKAPPTSEPVTAKADVLKRTCGRCHSGSAPKGGVLLDGTAAVDAATITKSLRWIADPSKAPSPMGPVMSALKAADKGAIMEQLLALEKK